MNTQSIADLEKIRKRILELNDALSSSCILALTDIPRARLREILIHNKKPWFSDEAAIIQLSDYLDGLSKKQKIEKALRMMKHVNIKRAGDLR